ncbi:hypothetical protein KTC96_24290 (plasmid) [Clostridium estertheticum]|uniref:hypothetical protein n=1 Tax=Clostridium estertheticum TaxID=238834 RepID=UPI001C7DEAB3|nr:hypothetical protein [Clostridium estertheticum]MBX4262693.1 hypothetical protein [Clostridium estertheticum]WLC73107.1 hypothetical protein KTC96_24290 [Clostridium estertheticum]
MKKTDLKTKLLASILCGAMTFGTSISAMAQTTQPTKPLVTHSVMAATTGVVIVNSVFNTTPGNYTLNGTGFNNLNHYEVYDADWNKVGTVRGYNNDVELDIAITYAKPGDAAGYGVILFFDAAGNQIGGSQIYLQQYK